MHILIQEAQLIVSEGSPRVVGLARPAGFSAISVALFHR